MMGKEIPDFPNSLRGAIIVKLYLLTGLHLKAELQAQ